MEVPYLKISLAGESGEVILAGKVFTRLESYNNSNSVSFISVIEAK
jgi:hypothetical protein